MKNAGALYVRQCMIILSENILPVFSMSFKFHLNECFMDFCDAWGYVKIPLQTYQGTQVQIILDLNDYSMLLYPIWKKKKQEFCDNLKFPFCVSHNGFAQRRPLIHRLESKDMRDWGREAGRRPANRHVLRSRLLPSRGDSGALGPHGTLSTVGRTSCCMFHNTLSFSG